MSGKNLVIDSKRKEIDPAEMQRFSLYKEAKKQAINNEMSSSLPVKPPGAPQSRPTPTLSQSRPTPTLSYPRRVSVILHKKFPPLNNCPPGSPPPPYKLVTLPSPNNYSTPMPSFTPRPTPYKVITLSSPTNNPTPRSSFCTPTCKTLPTPCTLFTSASSPDSPTPMSSFTPPHQTLPRPTPYKVITLSSPPNDPAPRSSCTPTRQTLPTPYTLVTPSPTSSSIHISRPTPKYPILHTPSYTPRPTHPILHTRSSRTAPSAETAHHKRLQSIVQASLKPFAKRGQPLNSSQQRAVTSIHQYFAKECLNNGPFKSLGALKERTAEALGLGINTVGKVVRNGHEGEIVTPGKTRPREKKVLGEVDDFMKSCIRRVIYNMNAKGQKITMKELLKQCEVEGVGFPGKVTSLREVVWDLGFKWEKTDNRRVLMESPKIALQRIQFLRSYIQNMNSVNPLQPIFLDETWIFQRGTLGRTWQDKDVRSAKRGDMNDGRRFVVVHAGGRGGFVPNSSLLFPCGSNTADYHGEMNSDTFENWLLGMLGNLSEPSLIIMDNASYHSVQKNKQPTTSWKKEDIAQWLRDENIDFSPTNLKTELLDLSRRNRRDVVYRSDQLIQEMGHQVLRLPPYHCHFNPIELIWATTKQTYNDNIGRNGEYTVDNTKNVWKAALEELTAEEWGKRVDHCERIITETWATEMGMDMEGVDPMIINLEDDSDDSESDMEDEDDDEPLAIPLVAP